MFDLNNCHYEAAAEFGYYMFSEFYDRLATFESAAQSCAEALYDEFRDEQGERVFALVRVFRMCHTADLAPDLAELATDDADYWLALMGSIGAELGWCHRQLSRDHRLISPHMLSPLFQAAFDSLRITWGDPLSTYAMVQEERAWGTRSFFIPDVLDSSLVSDRDFVRRYDIQSVLGLGGRLADGGGVLLMAFANKPLYADCRPILAHITPYLMTLLAEYNEPDRIWGVY